MGVPRFEPVTPRIGISGWNYPPWRGVFYPKGLRQADELAFASRQFSSIEVNGSFYSLLRPATYAAWYRAVPDDFVFALKGSRFITHMKRLRNARSALANFFASGILALKEKLGPIVWQLPPTLRFDPGELRAFFELLPRTSVELEELAKAHDARLNGRALLEAEHSGVVRHALEVRHPSFLNTTYIELLREFGVASCVADSAGLYPVIEDLTADFSYARLHGSKQLYTSGYGPRELTRWAARVRAWCLGHDASEPRLVSRELKRRNRGPRAVYLYFDNDVKVRAPFDAVNLERLVSGAAPRRLPAALRSVLEEARTDWPAWR
jgi:uncharacterized protein YecE (DUF72 family)